MDGSKLYIFHFFTLFLFFTFYISKAQPKISEESDLFFEPHAEKLSQGEVQFFSFLLDKESKLIFPEKALFKINFDEDILPLDIFNYWENKGEEKYYVLITKTAFQLDKPYTYFNQELLTDIEYLRKTLPNYGISESDSGAFKMEAGFWSPSILYRIHHYLPPYPSHLNSAIDFSKTHFPNTKPSQMIVQHNFEYGKVLLQNTSKMSVSLTNYYEQSAETSLVVNYTLNYIYDIPPGLLGGHELLFKEIKKGIINLIRNTRIAIADKKQ